MVDGKNQAEPPKQQLSSTTNRDDSKQVGGGMKKRTTKRRETIAKRAYKGSSSQRIPQNSQTQHEQEIQKAWIWPQIISP